LARLRALAADPHLYAMGVAVTEGNARDHRIGGRPSAYPDWALVLFGAAIRVFGVGFGHRARAGRPDRLGDVTLEAERLLGADAVATLPAVGPTVTTGATSANGESPLRCWTSWCSCSATLAVDRATEVGLLNPADPTRRAGTAATTSSASTARYSAAHCAPWTPNESIDTPDRLRPVRQDPARQRYGEAGNDMVWGTKFAIASVRSPLANHRVILGIAHFPTDTPGGEGRVFTDLALDLADRNPGIHAFTADGAWRGTHLAQVQSATGCGVITPGRRRTASRGGILWDGCGYAAQPLPWSRRRQEREAACGGHQLWAAAGTLFEQTITANGGSHFVELTRHQTKRDTTHRADGTTRNQFYARYTLTCSHGPDHDWWEPLLPVATDTNARFNRCEYLRVIPTTSPSHQRLYGMRQDTESLNAQLERAFYGQRLPAWGAHNQTTIVLLAALADNAWARHVWFDQLRRQAPPPSAHAA
jgi:hypothetical protein